MPEIRTTTESATQPSPLAVIRFLRRMSQRDLATLAGIDKQTVVNVELGRHEPQARTVAAISEALGLSPDVLFPIRPVNEASTAGNGARQEDARVTAQHPAVS